MNPSESSLQVSLSLWIFLTRFIIPIFLSPTPSLYLCPVPLTPIFCSLYSCFYNILSFLVLSWELIQGEHVDEFKKHLYKPIRIIKPEWVMKACYGETTTILKSYDSFL